VASTQQLNGKHNDKTSMQSVTTPKNSIFARQCPSLSSLKIHKNWEWQLNLTFTLSTHTTSR